MAEEALLGTVLGVVLRPFECLVSRAMQFRNTFRKLGSSVEHNIPVVRETEQVDEVLNLHAEVTERLREQVQVAQEDLTRVSNIPFCWKCCCLACYQYKLQARDEMLQRSNLELLPSIANLTQTTLITVAGTHDGQLMGRFRAPKSSHPVVGFKIHFNKLKKELLKTGASVNVLTGLAGSGKTTLATQLCWDEHVRGKFRGNIFFIPVSDAPMLTTIVKTLFQNCGREVPHLGNDDEHAARQLKLLLEEIGESPLMLVLDDVHPSSAFVVDKFQVQLLDYKVLVTSRYHIRKFGLPCQLGPLLDEDAVSLFRHFALPNDRSRSSYIPDKRLIEKIAKACKGHPLVLELIGTSLRGQPIEVWQEKETMLSEGPIVVSDGGLLRSLQKCLDDLLKDEPLIKECFNDLGLFPRDRKIPVAALIDMWTELEQHKLADGMTTKKTLDDGDRYAMKFVNELTNRHLVNLTREVASDEDNYYNHHFLTQHDLLREIAMDQARQEPFEQRKRLIFDINENNSLLQNQTKAMACALSITISSDQMWNPEWSNILTAEAVEVLILNLRTDKYTLPEFMLKMSELKVLIVTNSDGFHFSELNKFGLLSSLSSLKRIRLEQVSVPSLGKLSNLRKLSLYMCDISQAFQSETIPISNALPNLEELSIDNNKDLVVLPTRICGITSLKKLNITKCSRLSELPPEIGNLVNLKILRLTSCSKLVLIPAPIGRLGLLYFLDISGCINLGYLPKEIGDLSNLEKLYMTDCSKCKLPQSVSKLQNLRTVVCDANTAMSWEEHVKTSLHNLEIKKVDIQAYLFGEGAVGDALQEVLEVTRETTDRTQDNRQNLEPLASIVNQIKQSSEVLDRSTPGRLRARKQPLVKRSSMHKQTKRAERDLVASMSKLRDWMGSHGKKFTSLCSPEKPGFTVGLDKPLMQLKIELLKRGGDVSIHVLTGLEESGKSTLAKKLCWDKEVRGRYILPRRLFFRMFRENIFFIDVPRSPNLKTIVERLLLHCGSQVPEFQSDEEAISHLELLLTQVGDGGSPILLVLDGVSPGSEALVEKFKLQIKDYKILVTSRVASPNLGNAFYLEPLHHDDAVSLFRHFAQLNVSSSYVPDENLVHEIVEGCKGSPLALTVIGRSLCRQDIEIWNFMRKQLARQSFLESNTELLGCLQNSLYIFGHEFSIIDKECFMDLGLFPEGQMIRVPTLIDMWAELYKLDDDGKKAMNIIHDLANRNLVNVIVETGKLAMDTDMYYNNHSLRQHNILRDLAIHQSSQEPFEKRERLIIDLSDNNCPEWLAGQKQVVARTLSISTDENFTSDWWNLQPDEVEVLILNIRSSKYTLPEFTEKMNKLKVLIVTNYSFRPSELNKFEQLGYLLDLKRIRLEKVSVPCLCKFKSLQKLSLYMCNTRQAFESSSIQISDALSNLLEMNIDYSEDLVELPSALCKITALKTLNITNCHNLSALPQEIGNLKNLVVLKLNFCSDLLEMPESFGGLQNLRYLDISGCINLIQLPEDIGNLYCLEKLNMRGCTSLHELPSSVMDLRHLNHVICNEDVAALWEHFTSLPNLKIDKFEGNFSLDW